MIECAPLIMARSPFHCSPFYDRCHAVIAVLDRAQRLLWIGFMVCGTLGGYLLICNSDHNDYQH